MVSRYLLLSAWLAGFFHPSLPRCCLTVRTKTTSRLWICDLYHVHSEPQHSPDDFRLSFAILISTPYIGTEKPLCTWLVIIYFCTPYGVLRTSTRRKCGSATEYFRPPEWPEIVGCFPFTSSHSLFLYHSSLSAPILGLHFLNVGLVFSGLGMCAPFPVHPLLNTFIDTSIDRNHCSSQLSAPISQNLPPIRVPPYYSLSFVSSSPLNRLSSCLSCYHSPPAICLCSKRSSFRPNPDSSLLAYPSVFTFVPYLSSSILRTLYLH